MQDENVGSTAIEIPFQCVNHLLSSFLSSRRLPLTLTYTPISLFKLQFYAAQSMRNQWTMIMGDGGGGEDDDEQDSLKVGVSTQSPLNLN